MKRELSLARIALVVVVGCALAQTPAAFASLPGELAAATVSESNYRHYLDDMLYTHLGDARGLTGPEHDLARDNIAILLASFGLTITLEPFEYDGQIYYNVVGEQAGTVDPDVVYVVGAHFDSAMYEDLELGNGGADDDASGVALVLEAARVLSDYDSDYTIRYIAFDREEQWMIGSYAYVIDHLGDNIVGMFNADMIAYNSGADTLRVGWSAEYYSIVEDVIAAVSMYGGGLASQIIGVAGDHLPFEQFGFPACVLADHAPGDTNPLLHSINDHVDMPCYMDYEYAANATRVAVGYLVDHAGVNVPIPDADFDTDGDVDPSDFEQFEACLTGPGDPYDPACSLFDFDADGDIDCKDANVFSAVWTGPPSEPPIFWTCVRSKPADLDGGPHCIAITAPEHELPMALLVTGLAGDPPVACISHYVEADGRLGSEPFYQTCDAWGEAIVCDNRIAPGAMYNVQCEYDSPGGVFRSADMCVSAARWGDTVGDFVQDIWTAPNGEVDFRDILAVVEGFRHLPTAPRTYLLDQIGASGNECVPDLNIDFLDISAAVEAFKSYSYWETTSCPLPCE